MTADRLGLALTVREDLSEPVEAGIGLGDQLLGPARAFAEHGKAAGELVADAASFTQVAENVGILPNELEPYGQYKAKIRLGIFDRLKDRPDGKLILVTAMTATRAGEGKTVCNLALWEPE